jgi:hypothetical protein
MEEQVAISAPVRRLEKSLLVRAPREKVQSHGGIFFVSIAPGKRQALERAATIRQAASY